MSKIVEDYQKRAKFSNEEEGEQIRLKLEAFVSSILVQVGARDKRFESSLICSGSVYEGVKVQKPDEFDFMIRINSLSNKPSLKPCDKGNGYVKLSLDNNEWDEFNDEDGFFSPNKLSYHFRKLVNESLSDVEEPARQVEEPAGQVEEPAGQVEEPAKLVEVPAGLAILRIKPEILKSTACGPFYSNLLGNITGNPAGLYSNTHGPATTLYLRWQGGDYKDLTVNVDLTLAVEYPVSRLPVPLPRLPQEVEQRLEKNGFHVVPVGFNAWRISFSVVEKEVIVASPEVFKACFRVLKIMRDISSERLGLDPILVPSYVFKTVLLSQLFSTELCWGTDHMPELITNALEEILQGIKCEEIKSVFIPRYNLLSAGDHENMLRRFIVKEMLDEVEENEERRVLTKANVQETRQQIRVLQMIDLLEYLISISSTTMGKKEPSTACNKMVDNDETIPQSSQLQGDTKLDDCAIHQFPIQGDFWNQLAVGLNSKELDNAAYQLLTQIWGLVDMFINQLFGSLKGERIGSLKGELSIQAQELYKRTHAKIQAYEQKHQTGANKQEKMPLPQLAYETAQDLADSYINEDGYGFWSNLYKRVPSDYKSADIFKDVADVTDTTGSAKGLAMFKERMRQYFYLIPEQDLMHLIVNYFTLMYSFAPGGTPH